MAAGTSLRQSSIRGGVSSGGAVPPELSVHLSAAAGPSGKQSHPTVSHSAAIPFGGPSTGGSDRLSAAASHSVAIPFGGPSTGGSDRLSAAAGLFDGQRPAIVSHSVGLCPGGYRFACPRQPVHRAVSLPAAPGLLVDCSGLVRSSGSLTRPASSLLAFPLLSPPRVSAAFPRAYRPLRLLAEGSQK